MTEEKRAGNSNPAECPGCRKLREYLAAATDRHARYKAAMEAELALTRAELARLKPGKSGAAGEEGPDDPGETRGR